MKKSIARCCARSDRIWGQVEVPVPNTTKDVVAPPIRKLAPARSGALPESQKETEFIPEWNPHVSQDSTTQAMHAESEAVLYDPAKPTEILTRPLARPAPERSQRGLFALLSLLFAAGLSVLALGLLALGLALAS